MTLGDRWGVMTASGHRVVLTVGQPPPVHPISDIRRVRRHVSNEPFRTFRRISALGRLWQ